ncbi:MAG: rRNA maturation RNase YbeY [Rickettsiales bacterium]
MSTELDISFHITNDLWKSRLRPYTKTVGFILNEALAFSGLHKKNNTGDNFEIAVVFVDDKFIRNINHQYRGKNKPTNVLSFPNGDFSLKSSNINLNLGDIILALETIEKEAKEQKKTFRNHSAHLLVHGFLHLLGYDHMNEKDAKIMENMEIKILKKLDISNPYL